MPGISGAKAERVSILTCLAEGAKHLQAFRCRFLLEGNLLIDSSYTAEEKKVRETVTKFLLGAINISNLKGDDHIFESGVVNSLFAVELMTFLEKSFAIEIGMDDLDMENFKSINATAAFVMAKKGWQSTVPRP